MSLSTRFRLAAQKMIRDMGKDITYIAITPGAYNLEDSEPAITKVEHKVKAILYHFAINDTRATISDSNRTVGGSGLIQGGDIRVTVSAMDLTVIPKVADRVRIDVTEWAVLHVKTTYAGELPVTFEIHTRRT